MAIQNRRGIYSDFDPTKMVEGEFAVVQSGDPNTSDGKAVYIAPTTGTAERVALYKDLQQEVQAAITDATDEVIQEVTAGIIEGVAEDVTKAETAATNAETSAQNAEASAEEAQEVLENKADNNGYYPDLYAGNLSSTRKQTNFVPYLMRKTGGDLSRIGERESDTLVGATVNVNQLVDTDTSSVTIQSGHKYYAKISGTESIGASTGTAIAVTGGTDMVVDLTAMLGSTIADYLYSLESATSGAGIAKLKELGFCTDKYIPHNPGSLESVEARSHVLTGKNIWGGLKAAQDIVSTVPNATINESGKTVNYSAPYISGKKLYKFPDPNTQYTIIMQGYNTSSGQTATNIAVRYQDGSVIGLSSFVNGISITVTNASKKVESLVGIWATASTVLYYEKCGVFRGVIDESQFEPYSAHTYDLGTDTLLGLFKLDSNNNLYADGDTKTSDGTVTRKYGVVDLGTLDYVAYTHSSLGQYFYASVTSLGVKYEGPFSPTVYSTITTRYPATARNGTNFVDKTFCFDGSVGSVTQIQIKDSAYSDATAFKNAMSGVMLVYELATPTTETSTPFQNPQICDPDGTEEYVTSNGVPVGHETEYDYDIKGLAEELIDVPDVPSSNGTYVLKATRSADGISYEWVSYT